ncbi:SUPPRESSOR OF ABI3-5-like [Papaver somniferum]|uniref:SUPPRESSOR OF ABI3-5-like n=1 Tax=Papaver somniferum TaxID=3469 RepID=UPI000E700500|nr:SUPPRESSOR OF ABI3-5-like [Papaver somniferum]
MDFTRHLLQEEWVHVRALEGHPVVHEADLRIGGTDSDRRFDMALLSEATYPRKAYHRHIHDRDTHAYSYRGIDSSHDSGFDRPTRFAGRNHADFAPYDIGHDYRHHMSRRREDRHERDTDYGRSIYGSDCDKSRKRDGSWERCDSLVRVRDRQRSSWKRDQSPEHSLYCGHYDRQRIRSPRVHNQWKGNYDDRRNYEHSSVVPSSTVRVRGLSSNATKEDVYQILAEWGPICNVRVLKEKESSTCRGFAFIDFPSVRAARTMMEEVGYDGLVDDGRELSFEYSFKKIKSKSRVLHEKLNSKRRRLRQLERDAVAARAQQQQQEEKEVQEEEGEVDDRDVVEVELEDWLAVDEETEVEDREAGEGEAEVDEETEVEDREAGEGKAEVEELVQGEQQQTEVEDREAEVEELVQREGEEQLQQKQQRQLVEELEIGEILHGPSSHGISASMSCEELEERMDCIKEDPYLKVVIEDIEIGGPDVMMRYLSDPEVLQKLGHAMGFTVSEGIVNSTEHTAREDAD